MTLTITGRRSELGRVLARRPVPGSADGAHINLAGQQANTLLHDDVVFVLTTSDTETDRLRAYHQNVAGYMVKAAVGPQFSKLAQLLSNYQAAVRLP